MTVSGLDDGVCGLVCVVRVTGHGAGTARAADTCQESFLVSVLQRLRRLS